MTPLKNIPANLQTNFLSETVSDIIPEVRRECNTAFFPAFVRQEQVQDDAGTSQRYRFFDVAVPYTGQDLAEYDAFAIQSYADLRRFFYGISAIQNEQILKGTFASHQYAVRLAFPKSVGEIIEAVKNFEAVKSTFWTIIDEVAASVGKTRDDFLVSDTSTELMAYAATLGMSAEQVGALAVSILGITADLARFGRNWTELFHD